MEDVYALLIKRLTTALANLPRCRVRDDAVSIGVFLARLAPRAGGFAFATTIQDHPRFQRWCGVYDSNGKPWTRQRIRSCRDALIKVEFLQRLNDDTVCYYDPSTQGFRDTPNRYEFGAEFGSLLALPASSAASSKPSTDIPSIQISSSETPTIRPSRVIIKAPLVVVVRDVVIMGRVRSDIVRAMVARRDAARRAQTPDPAILAAVAPSGGGALDGMSFKFVRVEPKPLW